MRKKILIYRGLQFTPVWFEDTSLTSPDYFKITEFPTELTAGKNLFKLQLNKNKLRLGSLIECEVLDYNGNTIYHELIDYIDADKSRVFAIYIYSDTPVGDCTITLLGEAINVPHEWIGRPNVKWTRNVTVNSNKTNMSEIIFSEIPSLQITEQVGVQLDRNYITTQFPTYNSGSLRYYSYNNQPVIELINGVFTPEMVNGTVNIETPINATPIPTFNAVTTKFNTTIKKVLTPTTALLDKEYTYFSTSSLILHTYTKFDDSVYTLIYESSPKYIPTQNSESFAIVEINGLQPVTGDVARIKLFANNTGTVGTWEQINDVLVTPSEIFVTSTASLEPDRSIGFFTTQSIIDTYWEGFTYELNTLLTAPTLTWHTASISNAMHIQNAVDIANDNTITIAKIKSEYKSKFTKDSSYSVTLDAINTNDNNKDSVLSIYLSGSAVSYEYSDIINQKFNAVKGKKLGELRSKYNFQRFDDNKFEFNADFDGDAVLLLVVENGEWKVSDIRTTSVTTNGYTPNYNRIRTLVPTSHKSNNQLSFKAEYYNSAGQQCKQASYAYNNNWVGGNRYIDGDYSMITGSLYVADSLDSGIAISGYKNSGYIRSLGYNGFTSNTPGFLLWSGSAMSGSAMTKGAVPYGGVGLELYANTNNYFRYATNPSELDVRTQTFFLGSTSPTNFISGSNGNLQISSSNFNLSAEGNVTASNIYLENVATADGFVYNTITINDSNYTQYYRNYTISGLTITGSESYVSRSFTTIVLDGSLGGAQGRQVRIERLPDYPIGTVLPPGYEFESSRGYDITIENFAYHNDGGFSSLPIASWVAENDTNSKGADDFGFGGEMWDIAASTYQARNIDYQFVKSLSPASSSIPYGEGQFLEPQLYGTVPVYNGLLDGWYTINGTLSGQTMLMYFGNQFTFQRSTHGENSNDIRNGFWQLMSYDSAINNRLYFANSLKIGNQGVLIGGSGNPGSRFSDYHSTTPHSSAVLQLDAKATAIGGGTGATQGTASVFIPPRFDATYAPGNAVNGSMFYNTVNDTMRVYAAGAWRNMYNPNNLLVPSNDGFSLGPVTAGTLIYNPYPIDNLQVYTDLGYVSVLTNLGYSGDINFESSLTVSGSTNTIGTSNITGSLTVSGSSQISSSIRIALPSGSVIQNYSVPISKYKSFGYDMTTRPVYNDQYINLGYDSTGTDPELTILTDPIAGKIQACVFSTSTGTSTITDINTASGVTDIWSSGIGSDERLDITLSAGADTTYPFYKITMFRSNITYGGNVHCVVERYFTDL